MGFSNRWRNKDIPSLSRSRLLFQLIWQLEQDQFCKSCWVRCCFTLHTQLFVETSQSDINLVPEKQRGVGSETSLCAPTVHVLRARKIMELKRDDS